MNIPHRDWWMMYEWMVYQDYVVKEDHLYIAGPYLMHLHWSSYAIGLPVVDLGYETTHLYPTLDR